MKFEGVFFTLFCFHFRSKQLEVDLPGPRRDHCVSKFVLHWTVLIKDFSVVVTWNLKGLLTHSITKKIMKIHVIQTFQSLHMQQRFYL